jgi:hypothetical protein
MERQADVMIIGLGSVGGWCLELLMREPSISRIVAADIRETYGMQKVNTAITGAYQMGYYPEAEFMRMDVLESVEKNAEIIRKVNPRLVMNGTTMWAGWHPEAMLPPDVMEPITGVAGLGPYLPFHMRLLYHVMLAVKASGLNPYVVNASLGDITGPALKTQGLAPTVGMGNLDNMAVLVKKQVADKEGVKARDVIVYLVAHHFNNVWFMNEAPGPRPPYFIKVLVGDRDVTDRHDTYEMLKNSGGGRMRLSGTACDSQVGSAMCKHALALLNDRRILTNAVSPHGMPGGYPARIGADGVKLALPEGITEEEAIKINLEGQRRDGVKEITEDGTVIYEDAVVEGWKKIMDFDCTSFHVTDVDKVAEEQMSKFQALIKKYSKG